MRLFKSTFYPLLVLAIPLALTGLLESGVFFFETLFLARLGPDPLAAGALVSWLFGTFSVILFGVLNALNILIAQQHGAQNERAIALIIRDGIWLAFLFVVPTSLLFWNMPSLFLYLGQSPEVVLLAKPYLHALVWGILPDLIMIAWLEVMVGLGHTRPILVFSLLSVSLTVFSSFVLIFGKFGFPALGVAGAGWGTTISYWISGIALTAYVFTQKTYRPFLTHLFTFTKRSYLFELLTVGTPMGIMYCIEVGFFFVLTLIMGSFGSALLAANQIALQYMGALMAVIFSLAQAITVRMGHLLGAGNTIAAKQAGYAGMTIAAGMMLLAALTYWMIPTILISFDLDLTLKHNANIIHVATQLLSICAIFQLFEGTRIALFGALRGLKDTRFTLFISIFSFWGIALPLGYTLATRWHWGGTGLWWGMVIGAACSLPLLLGRFQFKMKNYIFI